MTDRELLELAAKAAGVIVDESDDSSVHGLHSSLGELYVVDAAGWHYWEPLTDDGDALRLAVKLGLWVNFTVGNSLCEVSSADDTVYTAESLKTDRYAATRSAIVRAAAEIGKAMP